MRSAATTDYGPMRSLSNRCRIICGRSASVVLGVSAFLLASMGGAIVAAPVTVPLLYLIAQHRTGWRRGVAIVLGALTIAEVAWATTYTLVNESKPWIWLLPLIAAVVVAALATRSRFSPHNCENLRISIHYMPPPDAPRHCMEEMELIETPDI